MSTERVNKAVLAAIGVNMDEAEREKAKSINEAIRTLQANGHQATKDGEPVTWNGYRKHREKESCTTC